MKLSFNQPIRTVFPASAVKNSSKPLSFCRNSSPDTFFPSQSLLDFYDAKERLNSIRKFTIEDYEQLTPAQIKAVFAYVKDEELFDAVNDNITIAEPLKNFLDKKYGEDKYVFVSIGTSPAPLGRVFEFSGVETKYLPISDLKSAYGYEDIVSSLGYREYEKFLREQGISKKDVEKSPKTFVFYDYTSSGWSLSVVKDFMLKHLQLPEDKVAFRSLDHDIISSCKNIDIPDEYDAAESVVLDYLLCSQDSDFVDDYIFKYLHNSQASMFGGVGHLTYSYLRGIGLCKRYESELSKLYNLFLIDLLSEQGALKNNQKNKKSL